MAIATLSQASRFNAGSDLWVLPAISKSQQTLQVDWYLNFQISQNYSRPPKQRPPELQRILNLVEWPLEDHVTYHSKALLISASYNLPCRWVAVIQEPDHLDAWTKSLFELWRNLNQPSLRVFLPAKVTTHDWFSIWRSFTSFEDLSVVLDS